MSVRYAPLPNPRTDPDADNELEAAFDDSDDEEDQHSVKNSRNGYHSLPNEEYTSGDLYSQQQQDRHHQPGTYDFENVDYDYTRPPPGSPPGPSARALPNEFGNSNGLVPALEPSSTDAAAQRGWFRRTAEAVLPSHYVQRLGLAPQVPSGVVGGGTSNDGVFANVTAKPTRPVRVQDGDSTYLVPEETQKDAPPSYAVAQADSAPPYWETTIHAPSSSNTPGDMIIDNLPTGSLFSFLWNMLVSISFQFVGFLLTYLLHTTHAAKLGSRAGLGITLIQYGFAMRSRSDEWLENGADGQNMDSWGVPATDPKPTFETAADAEEWYKNFNATAAALQTPTPPDNSGWFLGDAAAEWLSFFLMTVGWFLLLTSILGFWRVKRWERSILSTQQSDSSSSSSPSSSDAIHVNPLAMRLEQTFGLRGLASGAMLRQGLGIGGGYPGASATAGNNSQTLFDASFETGEEADDHPPELRGEYVIPIENTDDPEAAERLVRAYQDEARLTNDLRAAGLL
ncbi:unnamed protein product [Somion occarium]|uniref:Metal homeostatis protein bsd2 n=1 Tax=Somion occarium TaxID=3059160 RepID=A0ABP1CY12_9APHY